MVSDEGWVPVDLYEYQAKELFAAHGVPVLAGEVADTPEQARAAAARHRRPPWW